MTQSIGVTERCYLRYVGILTQRMLKLHLATGIQPKRRRQIISVQLIIKCLDIAVFAY